MKQLEEWYTKELVEIMDQALSEKSPGKAKQIGLGAAAFINAEKQAQQQRGQRKRGLVKHKSKAHRAKI